MRLTTNPYVNLNDLFKFEFNYLNQHDLPGIDLFLSQNHSVDSVDQIPHTHTIFKDKLNLFDFSENFISAGTVERLSALLTSIQIPHLILGSDPSINTDIIYYFPLFYIATIQRNQPHQLVFEHSKKYKISCLNKTSRRHRIQNYIKLIEKNYKDILVTFNDDYPEYDPDSTMGKQYQMLKEQGVIPLNDTVVPHGRNTWSIQHDAYRASCVNIVTETQVSDTVFLTEKVWKPIASGQLFFVVGSKGTVDYLRSLGIDVFDDVIDNSYDLVPDWSDRIDCMYNSIDKLLDLDIEKIYNNTRDRRKQNQELFFAGKFGMQYVDKINSKFTQ